MLKSTCFRVLCKMSTNYFYWCEGVGPLGDGQLKMPLTWILLTWDQVTEFVPGHPFDHLSWHSFYLHYKYRYQIISLSILYMLCTRTFFNQSYWNRTSYTLSTYILYTQIDSPGFFRVHFEIPGLFKEFAGLK